MFDEPARQNTIAALQRLFTAGGGCPDSPGGPADPGATLSVIKSLELLGSRARHPDPIDVYASTLLTGQSVLTRAAALLTRHAVGAAADPTDDLRWMADRAGTREEHFMTIAVADECAVRLPLPRSVAYFRSLEQPDGTFGPSRLANGIAASALLRVGEPLADPAAVTDLLLGGQTRAGGFADDGPDADLWTTYCIMRALSFLGVAPDRSRLAEWVLGFAVDGGGFGTAGVLSANTTYQCLSVLDWIAKPVLDAARRGDTAYLRSYLDGGGNPDLTDLTGWTPLAAAAVRGQAPVVRLLLAADPPADPDRRVPDADALPVFWAGQAGDTATVRALLAHRPEHLFATSSVNGHTVLLQAAFFGTERHRDLIAALLDTADSVQTRHRLLAACNVRGYTATTMARLWNNEALIALLSPVDDTTADERDQYHKALLASIALPEPSDEDERAAQRKVDALIGTIMEGFPVLDAERFLATVTTAIESGVDLNRLGGPLAQTPVIAAVTGVDTDEVDTDTRVRLTALLLRHGADPDLPERHPMGVDAVIRASVLNHFACLREIAAHMPPLAFAAALNERPAINGQTALDDAVHRALTASESTLDSHLEQIRWMIAHGGRTDIPDLTGITVADRARTAATDAVLGAHAPRVLAALGADSVLGAGAP